MSMAMSDQADHPDRVVRSGMFRATLDHSGDRCSVWESPAPKMTSGVEQMIDMVSFDILLIGLTTPGETGHARYANAMARLTARGEEEFSIPSPSFDKPIFSALDHGTAELVARTLGEAGALIEIRSSSAVARNAWDQVAVTDACPTKTSYCSRGSIGILAISLTPQNTYDGPRRAIVRSSRPSLTPCT